MALELGAQAVASSGAAYVGLCAPSLGMFTSEERFACLPEGGGECAPSLCDATFNEELKGLLGILLEPDGQTTRVGFGGKPAVEAELVFGGEREASVILEAVQVIGIHTKNPWHGRDQGELAGSVRGDRGADIDPTLAGPAFIRMTKDVLRESSIGLSLFPHAPALR